MSSPSRKITNFRLGPELLDALYVIKERDGLTLVEQVRRALYAWIFERGVTIKPKAERERAATRTRP
jgi:hypothetical protein